MEHSLVERVVARLGFSELPSPDLEGLRKIYGAWCERIPFDNVRKLIHVRSGNPGPLPGADAEDFFEAWLRHGTGGTCWAGAGAFHALLESLGFVVERGVATMLVAPELPPNHGTVVVSFGQEKYLADCSLLHGEPLPISEGEEALVNHPAWGVKAAWRDGKAHISWRPLHMMDGLECRLDFTGATTEDYGTRYEKTRTWSPFNFEVSARSNRNGVVVGVGFGHACRLQADGKAIFIPIGMKERNRILIEQIGLSEEIVSQLPPDMPTPHPPVASAIAYSENENR